MKVEKEIKEYIDHIMKNEIRPLKEMNSEKHKVGTMCLFFPREILRAMDIEMLYLPKLSRIEEGKVKRISNIEQSTFSDTICCHSKLSYLENIPKGYPVPELFIYPVTCEPFTRLFERMRQTFDVRFVNIPHNKSQVASGDYWYKQICDVIKELEEKFSVKLDLEKLKECVTIENEVRMLLRKIMELRKDVTVLYNAEYARKIQVMYQELSREKAVRVLQELYDFLLSHKDVERDIDKRPRIMFVSTTTRDFVYGENANGVSTLDILDQCGCNVVLEDACSTQSYLSDIPLEGNIVRNVCDFYLKEIYCPCFMDETHMDKIYQLAKAYQVDGVIFRSVKGCRHFENQASHYRTYFEERNIPGMIYETTGLLGNSTGRVETQIESFVQILEGKKRSRLCT